jgi:hypothetical protein
LARAAARREAQRGAQWRRGVVARRVRGVRGALAARRERLQRVHGAAVAKAAT